MYIFPAIDLYDGKAVRLYKGDYDKMTVYSEDPAAVAEDFRRSGASHLHLVDLEGAKSGKVCNLDTVRRILTVSGLFTEIGGGIRNEETVYDYLSNGIHRVILGTAAAENREFLADMVKKYGERIAVGVDIRDGFVAVKGWTETSSLTCDELFSRISALGVSTVICTDITRDGAMKGTNRGLYAELSRRYDLSIIASGGVSTTEDVAALAGLGLYGAIIGKAYYTGAINLREAVRIAEHDNETNHPLP